MTDYVLWDGMEVQPAHIVPRLGETRRHQFSNGVIVSVTYFDESGRYHGSARNANTGAFLPESGGVRLHEINLWLREIAELGSNASELYDERPTR